MYEYLDRRYALALYEMAEKRDKVDEYLKDLREICDLIQNNQEFFEVIKHPQINTKKKKELFVQVFKGKIDEELLSFLILLIEKSRILNLAEILYQMENIDLERKNTVRGVVKTAVSILPEELEKLKNIFEKKYDKNIIFSTEVDESILGGVYVKLEMMLLMILLSQK